MSRKRTAPRTAGGSRADRLPCCCAWGGIEIRSLREPGSRWWPTRRRTDRCARVRNRLSFRTGASWGWAAPERPKKGAANRRSGRRPNRSPALLRFRVGALEAGVHDIAANGFIAFVTGVLEHLILVIELHRVLDRKWTDDYIRIFDAHLKFDGVVGGAGKA